MIIVIPLQECRITHFDYLQKTGIYIPVKYYNLASSKNIKIFNSETDNSIILDRDLKMFLCKDNLDTAIKLGMMNYEELEETFLFSWERGNILIG
jgi:hypothetical protein